MTVKTFKTSVKDEKIAELLIIYLQKVIPDFIINFDLDNRDHTLSLSGNREVSGLVIQVLTTQGIDCRPL